MTLRELQLASENDPEMARMLAVVVAPACLAQILLPNPHFGGAFFILPLSNTWSYNLRMQPEELAS